MATRPLLVLAAVLLAAAAAQGKGTPQVVATDDGSGGGPAYHYEPLRLIVPPGATVSVADTGQEPHTVTAADHSFDVTVQAGGQATFVAPTAPGEYRFYCKFHAGPTTQPGQGMAGVLVVDANATLVTASKSAPGPGPLPGTLLPLALAAPFFRRPPMGRHGPTPARGGP